MLWKGLHSKEGFCRKIIFISEFCARGYPSKEIHDFVGRFLKRNPLQFTMKGIMESLFKSVIGCFIGNHQELFITNDTHAV